MLPVAGINVYDILRRDRLVLTRAALEALRPAAASQGGNVIATGTPGQIANVEESYTGQFLAKMLNP